MSRCPIASAAVAGAQASIGFADPRAERIGRGGAAARHPSIHTPPQALLARPCPSPSARRPLPERCGRGPRPCLSRRLLGQPGSTGAGPSLPTPRSARRPRPGGVSAKAPALDRARILRREGLRSARPQPHSPSVTRGPFFPLRPNPELEPSARACFGPGALAERWGPIRRTPRAHWKLGVHRLEVGPRCPWPWVAFHTPVAAERPRGPGPGAAPPAPWASGSASEPWRRRQGPISYPPPTQDLGRRRGASCISCLSLGVRFTASLFHSALAGENRGGTRDLGFLPTRVGGAARRGAADTGRGGIPTPDSEEEPSASGDRDLCLLGFFFQNRTNLWCKTFPGAAVEAPLRSLFLSFRTNHEIGLRVTT